MYNGNRIVAIIMGKLESQRLPGKNSIQLPLMRRAVDMVMESRLVDNLLITGRGQLDAFKDEVALTAMACYQDEAKCADWLVVIQCDHVPSLAFTGLDSLIVLAIDKSADELRTVELDGTANGFVRLYRAKQLTPGYSPHVSRLLIAQSMPCIDVHTVDDLDEVLDGESPANQGRAMDYLHVMLQPTGEQVEAVNRLHNGGNILRGEPSKDSGEEPQIGATCPKCGKPLEGIAYHSCEGGQHD